MQAAHVRRRIIARDGKRTLSVRLYGKLQLGLKFLQGVAVVLFWSSWITMG